MVKSNLFEDLMTIHNTFERAFDRFFEGNWRRPNVMTTDGAWIPAAEAFVKDDLLTIRVALPGVDEKHVSLTLAENTLVISGERVAPNANQNVRALLSELPYGHFERKIALPEEVLTDDLKCKASFNEGMLEITLPVVSQYLRTRQIPIESAKEQKVFANA
jgi:HSP20 family protein